MWSLWSPPHPHILARQERQQNNTQGSSGTMWATVILDGPCQGEGNKNIHVSIYKHTMNAAIVKNFPLNNKSLPLKIFCVTLDTSVVSEIQYRFIGFPGASTRSKLDINVLRDTTKAFDQELLHSNAPHLWLSSLQWTWCCNTTFNSGFWLKHNLIDPTRIY